MPQLVRSPDRPAQVEPREPVGPGFAELHAVSSFSFLRGASDPEALVERAAAVGLEGLGLADRDGFYGTVRFARAAAECGLPTVVGAELSVAGAPILTLLTRGPEGYRRLSHVIADAHMAAGHKGAVCYPPLTGIAEELAGGCVVLADASWASRLEELIQLFGVANVVLEYDATMLPEEADNHRALDAAWEAAGGEAAGLRRILSARPVAATSQDRWLGAAKAALHRRQSIAAAQGSLHPLGAPWLRSGAELAGLVPGCEELLAEACRVAHECAWDFHLVAPELPQCATPAGHTEASWLTELTWRRAKLRYADRTPDLRRRARAQIAKELRIIEELNFPGYFLIVTDLVDFCRKKDIYCQGRGSSANSAVCFALGITTVEPVGAHLLFERFLSAERDGPPDIDLDIESTRREEVIQYVYSRYGRDNAAQVANVITYRRRGALRDAGRALGYPQGAIDGWSRGTSEPPEKVLELAERFRGQPRHLGIHSGGMVICDRPVADVVPTEWARKEGRSVVQWDKEDCAAAGLVKFDLLGLGMLEALHHMVDLVAETTGHHVDLWRLDPTEDAVYEMLCRGDALGVFQVESRAQLTTLPRLRPRCFFDLVVEVALIRPGPIQGGSVHPYLRRRDGLEEVTYDHPVLERCLGKTLGIPLFQEQLMSIAVDAAGFSGGQADALRRAMGSARSPERMAALREQFFQGLATTHGITGEVAEKLWQKIVAFAAYGFPESHAQAFAGLVYYSAWFKYHHPAEFYGGLLRAQPMGFYSPQSLLADARRHGVSVLPVDVQTSAAEATVPAPLQLRLGLSAIKGVSEDAAQRIAATQPFEGIADLARRACVDVPTVEALARAGALESVGLGRRQALWQAGVAATEKDTMLPGLSTVTAPPLPGMSELELVAADIATTGITPTMQPMALLRSHLHRDGVLAAQDLDAVPNGTRVRVAGIVTHRQRPSTAGGLTFFGMEDETGLMNVAVTPGLWRRYRRAARTARVLLVRGIARAYAGVVTIDADKLEELPIGRCFSDGSRDFR